MKQEKIETVLQAVRQKVDEMVDLLTTFDELVNIAEQREMLSQKQKEVEELLRQKKDIDEQSAYIIEREKVIQKRETEDRDRKISLDRREDELKSKLDRVNKILQE